MYKNLTLFDLKKILMKTAKNCKLNPLKEIYLI